MVLRGSGRQNTKIIGQALTPAGSSPNSVVKLDNTTELQDVTVENTATGAGSGLDAIAVSAEIGVVVQRVSAVSSGIGNGLNIGFDVLSSESKPETDLSQATVFVTGSYVGNIGLRSNTGTILKSAHINAQKPIGGGIGVSITNGETIIRDSRIQGSAASVSNSGTGIVRIWSSIIVEITEFPLGGIIGNAQCFNVISPNQEFDKDREFPPLSPL